MGSKSGSTTERALYAIAQLVRDAIIAGVPAAAITYVADNGYVGLGVFTTAMGIWRVIRPQVLAALDRILGSDRSAPYA
jgi:hypothetical protein